MDGRGCRWEESSIHIEGNATSFWYLNPIAAVRYILRYPLSKVQLPYVLVKQMYSNGDCVYAEMWTSDWWWKPQASFHVLSDSTCQRECVIESVSERTCQRASVSDCQREHVRERVRERVRDLVRECVRERVRERQSQIVRDCVSEFHRVRAGSVSRVSAPVLTGFL